MGTVVRVKPIIYFAKHEPYNMGHLLTAAAVHYRVTGQGNFLDIARKLGDYLLDLFGPMPPELAHFGFNPSNAMGAVDLYRTTGDQKYLELGRVFVEMRGSQPGGTDQNQQLINLRDESKAVGHGVSVSEIHIDPNESFRHLFVPDLLGAGWLYWKGRLKESTTSILGPDFTTKPDLK